MRQHDVTPRRSWRARLLTLLAIMGPGLIVMVGDNDAGGVAIYIYTWRMPPLPEVPRPEWSTTRKMGIWP